MPKTFLGKIAVIVFIATALILAIHFLFGWIIYTVDSGFFHAFAQFLQTGKYIYPYPNLPYKHIHTQTAPLYSILLFFLYALPHPDVILHVLQLTLLSLTALLLYLILKEYIGKYKSILLSCLFILIPGNIIFTSLEMSEIGAQFIFMFYVFYIHRYVKTNSIQYLSTSIFIGFLAGLWRYSFVIYGIVSLLYFIAKTLNDKMKTKPKIYAFPLLGIILITGWVFIQHQLTGVWGISLDSGIRYNIQMMQAGKVLPPESDPSMKKIRKYIPKNVDLKKPYYELEPYLVPYIGYDYIKMNKIIGDVGLATIKYHPLTYLRVSLSSFFQHHLGIPYSLNLAYFGESSAPEFPPINCDKLGKIQFCDPLIKTSFSYPFWNSYVRSTFFFYTYIAPILSFGIFFPSLVWLLLFSSPDKKVFAILFIIGRLFISFATAPWSGSRYVLPFYPLMIIIVVLAYVSLRQRLKEQKEVKPDMRA